MHAVRGLPAQVLVLVAALVLVLVSPCSGQPEGQGLNLLLWPNNTAFGPPSAGTTSVIPALNMKAFVQDYASAVVTGTITNTLPQSEVGFGPGVLQVAP
jgi:hypothetical protein